MAYVYVLYEEVLGAGQNILGGYSDVTAALTAYHECLSSGGVPQSDLYLTQYDGEDYEITAGPCWSTKTFKREGTANCSLLRGHKGDHYDLNIQVKWGR